MQQVSWDFMLSQVIYIKGNNLQRLKFFFGKTGFSGSKVKKLGKCFFYK